MMLLAATICSTVIGCPQELRAKIQSSEAMERFADDDTSWNELLKRIGSGEPAWIELEEYLAGLSDGHVTEELTTALGEALIHRPEQMLALIAGGKLGTNAIALCGNIGDDQATLAEALVALGQQERAVRAVRRKDLQAVRRRCLREIRQSKAAVKRSFR
jgi:hypothetical protein